MELRNTEINAFPKACKRARCMQTGVGIDRQRSIFGLVILDCLHNQQREAGTSKD